MNELVIKLIQMLNIYFKKKIYINDIDNYKLSVGNLEI